MDKKKLLRIIRFILSAATTTSFYSIIYFFWFTSPLPKGWNFSKMMIASVASFFIAGALSWLWVRNIFALCIGIVAGIIAGGAYVGLRFSDTNIGMLLSTWTYITDFGVKEIFVLLAPAAVSWFVTNKLMKLHIGGIVNYRHRVATLFAGSMLAGVLAYSLGPWIEFLSFTHHDMRMLRHWGSFFFYMLFIVSLLFGGLAGALHKGTILLKSVIWISTLGILLIPNGFSPRMANKIRHDGMLSMTEQIMPLINAIERFQKHENRLPNALDDLVPTYIPALPKTNLDTYPDYEYDVEIDQANPAYSIKIWMSAGLMDMNVLEYSSSGRPPYWVENWNPIIGKWIYYRID
jgi:hypothetical protein